MQPQDYGTSLRAFLTLWLGQLISGLGSSLTVFALGVWIYQTTGSTTQFAITTLTFVLPFALLAPVAGTLVDRWDRRLVMIGADSGQALVTLLLAGLLFTERLAVWHIYLAATASAIFGSFHGPAYGASIPLLVPKGDLVRMAGLGRLTGAVNRLLSPVLAGLLITTIGLHGVVLIDLATFLFALLTYALIRIPRPPVTPESAQTAGNFWRELHFVWRYLWTRPGLWGLVLIGGLQNLFGGIAGTLLIPLTLSITTVDRVGVILGIVASGTLMSGVVLSTWGGPKRVMVGACGLLALSGVGFVVAGWAPLLIAVAAGHFMAMFGGATAGSLMGALEQRKVDLAVQGRVFGVEGMIVLLFEAAAYPTAGLLADRIFEPAMAANGVAAHRLGPLIGSGPGRGMALLTLIMGLFLIATAALGYNIQRIRSIEDELPDVL